MFQFLLDLLLPQKPRALELLAMAPEEFAARAARNRSPAGKDVSALFEYSDPIVREAVWMLKYRGNKKIARLLAAVLYDELLAFLEEYAPLANFTDPLLIPVPLSKKRLRERGWNQCELLTDELERLDAGRNFAVRKDALAKTKETPSQTKTENRGSRMKNLANCFAVKNPVLVAGRNIILIDDVATTGATLEEARRALRNAGARKVIAFTVAH